MITVTYGNIEPTTHTYLFTSARWSVRYCEASRKREREKEINVLMGMVDGKKKGLIQTLVSVNWIDSCCFLRFLINITRF